MKGFLDKNPRKILAAVLLLSLAVNGYLLWQNRRLNHFYQAVHMDTVRNYSWFVRQSRENIEKALISSDSGKISQYLEEAYRDLNYLSLLVELRIYYIYGFFLELDFPHSPIRDIIGGMPQAEISDDFDIEFLTAAAENLKVVEEELWNIMREDFLRVRRSAGSFVMEKERGALLQAAFQQRLTPLPRRPQPQPQQELSERARELWEKWQHYEENEEEYSEKALEAAYEFWGGEIEREDIYVGGGGEVSIIATASSTRRGKSIRFDLYLELGTMEVIGQDIYAENPVDDLGEIPIPKPHRVGLEEGEAIAREFLRSRFGYQELDLNVGINREGLLRYVFWQVEKGVVLYFRQMSIEVAADNGEVLAFYRYYKDDFKPEPPVDRTPRVTRSEARGQVNPQNTLQDEGALVVRQDGTLCWRFLVEREGWQYRVYIDSQTRQEIAVERVGSW